VIALLTHPHSPGSFDASIHSTDRARRPGFLICLSIVTPGFLIHVSIVTPVVKS
jgi:hypothetical protein